jgi:hypothetical protein
LEIFRGMEWQCKTLKSGKEHLDQWTRELEVPSSEYCKDQSAQVEVLVDEKRFPF